MHMSLLSRLNMHMSLLSRLAWWDGVGCPSKVYQTSDLETKVRELLCARILLRSACTNGRDILFCASMGAAVDAGVLGGCWGCK
jgi:hypothetical protein